MLLVEDNPADALLARAALEAADPGEFPLVVASNLADATTSLDAVDVVLLDLGLPDASGLDGLRHLRELDEHVPVIVLTGADTTLAEAALAEGAQDYLLKGELDGATLTRAIRYARSRQELVVRARHSERWAHALIHSIGDVVTIHAVDGQLRHLARTGAARPDCLEDLSLEDLRRMVDRPTWRRIVRGFARWRRGTPELVEYTIASPEGPRHLESSGTNLLDDPSIRGIVVTTRDVSDRRAAQERLAHLALHDPLTQLPNRTLFHEHLDRALRRQRRAQEPVAVLLIDLDDFKRINDSFGHGSGDEVLRATTELLSAGLRAEDLLARLGGDEFVVVCEATDADEARKLAHRLQALLQRPFARRSLQLRLTMSIGIAISPPDDPSTATALLRDADLAMYRSKRAGRDRVTVFDRALEERARRRIDLEQQLVDAITNDEFHVVYQPVLDLRTRRVSGFEALLRWTNGQLGEVGPEEFIPVAEDVGLIHSIDSWVLRTALHDVAGWRQEHPDIVVSVNVSAVHLADPAFTARLAEALAAARVPPTALCLEITETALMNDLDHGAESLDQLRGLGVRVAIDDFGTGYSSLGYLKRLPLDRLKIDHSFVAGLPSDPNDRAIVAAILRLAQSLGLESVAEGIERADQLEALHRLGCDAGQGYLLSRPVAAEAALALLRQCFDQIFDDADAVGAELEDRAPESEALGVIAHELLQPMTIIGGYADLLEQLLARRDEQGALQAAAAISRNVAVADAMLRRINLADALGSGKLALELERVELVSYVEQVVHDLAQAVGPPIVLERGGTASVEVDPTSFREVLSNLITNAAKFTPADAAITVRVHVGETTAEIAVIDDGPGVPRDEMGALFRKYARLGSRKGTGLGLWLARRIARQHGGDIHYRRAESGGACFTVVLPLLLAPTRTTASTTLADSIEEDEYAAAVRHAVSSLAEAQVPEQVVSAAVRLVRDLGGSIVPARHAEPDVLPIDVSFGEGEPLLVVAPALSAARVRLEHYLPLFAEDARDVIQALRRAPWSATRGGVDPVTGLPTRRETKALVGRRNDARALLLLRPDRRGRRDGTTERNLARLLHSKLHDADVAGVWEDGTIVVASAQPLRACRRMLVELRDDLVAWDEGATVASVVVPVRRGDDLDRLVVDAMLTA